MNRLPPIVQRAALIALAAGLGFLIYWPSMHGPFLFDDIYYIERNPAIKHLDKPATIFWGNVTPLRFIPFWSFAVNYQFHRLETTGFHAVNVIIHLINAGLVWWLAWLILQTRALPEKKEVRYSCLPWLSALLFLTHPLATQAVSYLSQRFTSLVTLFYVLTVCLYAAYRLRGRWIFLVAAIASAAAAAFCKQIAITLPLAIFLFDRTFLRTRLKSALAGLALFSSIALIIPYFHRFAVISILSISQPSGSHMGEELHPGNYLLTQFRVLVTYLRLFVFPVAQNFLYDFPASRSLAEPATLGCLLLLIGLIALALKGWRHQRLIAFGILWFFLTISVESSVITIGHVIFEHRTYLPGVGIALAMSAGIVQLLRRPRQLCAAGAVLVIMLSLLTFQRNRIWSDEVLFWEDVAGKSPGLAKAHLNLGVAYAAAERWQEAIDSYDKAIALDAAYAEGYNNRGVVFMKTGALEKAMADFNKALELNGAYLNAAYNRGSLHARLGDYQGALEDLNRALKINPSHPESYNERGSVYMSLRRPQEALMDFTRAILYDPGYVNAYNNRGVVYNGRSEYDLAVRDFEQAIRLDPLFAPAHYNLSYAYYKNGAVDMAWASLKRAIELNYDVDAGYVARVRQAGGK